MPREKKSDNLLNNVPCNEQCLQAFLVIWTFDDICFVDLSLETVRVFWTVSRVFSVLDYYFDFWAVPTYQLIPMTRSKRTVQNNIAAK